MFGRRLKRLLEIAEQRSSSARKSAERDLADMWRKINSDRSETAVFVRYSNPDWMSAEDKELRVEQCEITVRRKESVQKYNFFRTEIDAVSFTAGETPRLEAITSYWALPPGAAEPVLMSTWHKSALCVSAEACIAVGSVADRVEVHHGGRGARQDHVEVPVGFGRPLLEELKTWVVSSNPPDATIIRKSADDIPGGDGGDGGDDPVTVIMIDPAEDPVVAFNGE